MLTITNCKKIKEDKATPFSNGVIPSPKPTSLQPPSYVFITEWGSKGSEDGKFILPYKIAIDVTGNVYITDPQNYCIQKFNSEGNFITRWGAKGSGNGQFERIVGVAVDTNGNVYITDRQNYCIQKFDSEGNFITRWGSKGSDDGQFEQIGGVAVDTNGNVYITDMWCIQKFTSQGNFILKWEHPIIELINSTDFGFSDIAICASDYIYASYWVSAIGFSFEEFNSDRIPDSKEPNIRGFVYCNSWIYKCSSSGKFIMKWEPKGINDSCLDASNCKVGITTGLNENIFVTNPYKNCVEIYDSNGNFITQWGSEGSDAGQFKNPSDVAVDTEGNVYVVDTGNCRVQKFAPNP